MTGGETVRRGLALSWDSDTAGRAASSLLGRLRPADGWVALTLLAVNLCVVVLSVEQADWAPTPNLAWVLLLAMLTAFVFYRLPVRWGLALLPGLVLGALTVTWQLSNFTFDGQPMGGAAALWDRLGLWLEAAREGSINIDKAPFAFGLVTASWLTGFFGAWVFLRHRNFWGVFALGGLGLFSNLTFLPPNTNLHLALYLFTALLLVARIQAVRRQSQWERRGIRYDEGLRALSLSDSFFLAIAVIAVAFLLPAGGAWSTATGAYESLRKPLTGFEGDFNRLFAGLPARRDIGFRVWDDVMAFQGTISPATTHTLLVESAVPMYWKARTYDTYTGKGWISEHTAYQPLDYTPDFAMSAPPQSRVTASYAVTPLYASQYLFAGPRVTAVDRDVEIETPASPIYQVDLTVEDPLASYPPALAEAGRALAERARQGGVLNKDDLSPLLPPNFRVAGEIEREDGRITAVTLEEALPNPPETLAVRSRKGVFAAHDRYIVTSSVPAAEPEQLRAAGTDYPVHVLDRYTQLPLGLPGRVRGLAHEVTVNGDTPYDKALMVEGNLKRLPYDLKVDPPPFDSDGVDFFLFEQRKGYSEYFASAMAVLLRSVGVPARVAVGYTTGDATEVPNLYAVTDSHSHAWVEVYFPGYSWIPFEPTPGAELPVVMIPGGGEAGEFSGPFLTDFDVACLDDFIEECGDYGEALPGSGELPGELAGGGAPVGVWVIVALGILAALAVSGWWGFRRYMSLSNEPAGIYRRVQALAALGGLAGAAPRTPYQFGQRLGGLMPGQREPVDLIVGTYVQARYGARTLSPEQVDGLGSAWRRLRYPLLRSSLFYRIFPRSDL